MNITIPREVLEQAYDYIDSVPDDRYNAEHIDREALAAALRTALEAAPPNPPHECKTEAEKIAFAFGWWKALEVNRAAAHTDHPMRHWDRTCPACQAAARAYPLPDALYADSKDWLQGDYAARVEWLHHMYEAQKEQAEMYAAPTAREPLTDEQIEELAFDKTCCQIESPEVSGLFDFARAIEAAHGIGKEQK